MGASTIRDAVHGQIRLSPTELAIIDTADFQRLRHVKQVGMTDLVYPGAHHTRFEHSLGTLHLASQLAPAAGLDADQTETLRLAALLHDIGHMPFSHDSEQVLQKYVGDHERIGARKIAALPIRDILSQNHSMRRVRDWAFGAQYGKLITFDCGADRLDYLLRDAHYTGVAYGVIDLGRILVTTGWSRGRPVIASRGLEAAESVMLARFSMFHTVYYHHAVRIARAMLQHAMVLSLEADQLDPQLVINSTDSSLLSMLWRNPSGSRLVGLLNARRLYKRALVVPWNSLDASARKLARSGKLAALLHERLGAQAVVDPPAPFYTKPSVEIERSGKPVPLGRCSPITSSLQKAADERATLIVAAEPSACEAAAAVAKKALGL